MINEPTSLSEEHKETVIEMLEAGDQLGAVDYLREHFQLSAEDALAMARKLEEQIDKQEEAEFIKEVRQSTSSASKVPVIIGLVFGSIGLLLLGLGAWFGVKANDFSNRAVKAVGTVERMVERQSRSDDKMSTYITYAPVIRYQFDGKEHTFTSPVSSSDPEYEVGDEVELLVDPENPRDASIDSFMGTWFVTALLSGMGLIFSLVGFFVARAFRS